MADDKSAATALKKVRDDRIKYRTAIEEFCKAFDHDPARVIAFTVDDGKVTFTMSLPNENGTALRCEVINGLVHPIYIKHSHRLF